MTDQGIERLLGGLIEKVENIGTQVFEVRKDMHEAEEKAANSRAIVHKRLDDYASRTGKLEAAIETMSSEVGEIRGVTDKVVALRQQAEGAGSLGRALLRVGGWVLASAGWAVGVYTYWTGRPPP